MKPSERIMEIYSKEVATSEAIRRSDQFSVPMVLQRIYCDSIIQYLDEQAEANGEANGK